MRKSFLTVVMTVVLVFSSFCVSAQDSTSSKRIREYYLSVGSIVPMTFSFKYKHQFSKKLFLKVGVIDMSYNKTTLEPANPSASSSENVMYSGGIEAGLEFRKKISNAFTFFHGPNTSLGYAKADYTVHTKPDPRKAVTTTQTIGGSYTLGLLFHISGFFYVAAEVNPAFIHSKRIYETSTTSSYTYYTYDFRLDTGRGVISLVFRK